MIAGWASNDSKLPRNLTLPYRASLSLSRRGKDFGVAKSEGRFWQEPKPGWGSDVKSAIKNLNVRLL